MLPTHGSVTSVFLLANALRYGALPDLKTWVRTAAANSAFLAVAINHEPTARFLLREGLVTSGGDISPTTRLRCLSTRADRQTLTAIAALLLEVAPPPWLSFAVIDRQVRYEIIPSNDLEGLRWLGLDLERLLLDAAPPKSPRDNLLGLGVGRAAELVILAALTNGGESAVHVSEISDRFGYDIESADESGVRRWEVKGCTAVTAGNFHLSRNEYEKCRVFESEWTIVQVQFASAALIADFVVSDHIANVRELTSAQVTSLIPLDTDHFHWESSARVDPPPQAWARSTVKVPANLRLPSMHALGLEALDLHLAR